PLPRLPGTARPGAREVPEGPPGERGPVRALPSEARDRARVGVVPEPPRDLRRPESVPSAVWRRRLPRAPPRRHPQRPRDRVLRIQPPLVRRLPAGDRRRRVLAGACPAPPRVVRRERGALDRLRRLSLRPQRPRGVAVGTTRASGEPRRPRGPPARAPDADPDRDRPGRGALRRRRGQAAAEPLARVRAGARGRRRPVPALPRGPAASRLDLRPARGHGAGRPRRGRGAPAVAPRRAGFAAAPALAHGPRADVGRAPLLHRVAAGRRGRGGGAPAPWYTGPFKQPRRHLVA